MSSREFRDDSWEQRVVDRLFSLKRADESDAAFARRLGLQPQHLSNYRNGHHGLSLQTAVRVAEGTGISLDWLLLGQGKPHRGVPESRTAAEARKLREA